MKITGWNYINMKTFPQNKKKEREKDGEYKKE